MANDAEDQPQAMAGVRVLESGRFFAAPLVGTLLGDMGAEVIRYEEPGTGDPLRHGYPPLIDDKVGPYFLWSARNKKSITLDLRKPRGQELFKELVRVSDVVTENFTPGTMARWGLGYEDLRQVNPNIIMLSVSAYGATGPYGDRPGIDHVIQAASGLMSITGEPDGPPTFMGIAIVDYVTGFMNTYAVQTALFHREKTGEGQWIDNSLFDTGTWMLEHKILHYTYMGEMAWREGSRGRPLSRAYPASDGEVFIVGLFRGGSAVLEATGLERFRDDPRFPAGAARPMDRAVADEMDAALEEWTRAHTIAEIEETLLPLGVMMSPVNDVAAIVNNPQYEARGNLVEVEHPELGPLRFQGVAPKLSRTPGRVESAAPLLGEHNDYVYGELLGCNAADIEELRAEGVI
jgi:crotonobetainyl-CoA:carnitine CoA-transferase CaiB-like acyl-CoA transferase